MPSTGEVLSLIPKPLSLFQSFLTVLLRSNSHTKFSISLFRRQLDTHCTNATIYFVCSLIRADSVYLRVASPLPLSKFGTPSPKENLQPSANSSTSCFYDLLSLNTGIDSPLCMAFPISIVTVHRCSNTDLLMAE